MTPALPASAGTASERVATEAISSARRDMGENSSQRPACPGTFRELFTEARLNESRELCSGAVEGHGGIEAEAARRAHQQGRRWSQLMEAPALGTEPWGRSRPLEPRRFASLAKKVHPRRRTGIPFFVLRARLQLHGGSHGPEGNFHEAQGKGSDHEYDSRQPSCRNASGEPQGPRRRWRLI